MQEPPEYQNEVAMSAMMTERTISYYQEHLHFTDAEIEKWSRILEIGSGAMQSFARYVTGKFHSTVISIDPQMAMPIREDLARFSDSEVKKDRLYGRLYPVENTHAGIAQHLPSAVEAGSIDSVIACQSVPLYLQSEDDISQFLNEILRVLKSGGEARIYPVFEGWKKDYIEKLINQTPNIDKESIAWHRHEENGIDKYFYLGFKKTKTIQQYSN